MAPKGLVSMHLKHYVVVLLCALAAVATLAAPLASARPFESTEEAAWQEAEAYWGAAPTLCTTITKEVVPAGSLGVDENGRDVAARATQPTIPVPCGVWVEDDELGTQELCSVLRHEAGHLRGYGHEDPALSDMPGCKYLGTRKEQREEAWRLWRWARTECRTARGPYRPRCWNWLKAEASKIRVRYA